MIRTFFSIIGTLLLLSACGTDEAASPTSLQHNAALESAQAYMSVRLLEDRGLEKVVAIVVKNPERVPIQSIRAWLQFDPTIVGATSLTIQDDRFSLFAPGEREIDAEEGLIKIGAASKLPIADAELTLASFTLHGSNVDSSLTFYDWRASGDGHTAILSLQQNQAVNVLSLPPSIEL